jgi:Flp pilus assembly protein TadD
LAITGKFEGAIAQAALAHQLDPLSPFVETGLAQIYSYSGQHQNAIRHLRGVIESDPEFFPGHHYLGTVLLAAKQYEEAAREFGTAMRLDENEPQPIAYLAYVHGIRGDRTGAKALLRKLDTLRKARHVSGFLFSIVNISLHEPEAALTSLETAYSDRDDILSLIKIDNIFAPLRFDLRFHKLLTVLSLDNEPL